MKVIYVRCMQVKISAKEETYEDIILKRYEKINQNTVWIVWKNSIVVKCHHAKKVTC